MESKKITRRRDNQLFIRVTNDEKKKILALAGKAGMDLSEYLRHLLAGKK